MNLHASSVTTVMHIFLISTRSGPPDAPKSNSNVASVSSHQLQLVFMTFSPLAENYYSLLKPSPKTYLYLFYNIRPAVSIIYFNKCKNRVCNQKSKFKKLFPRFCADFIHFLGD
jgi:hypothetical protein